MYLQNVFAMLNENANTSVKSSKRDTGSHFRLKTMEIANKKAAFIQFLAYDVYLETLKSYFFFIRFYYLQLFDW